MSSSDSFPASKEDADANAADADGTDGTDGDATDADGTDGTDGDATDADAPATQLPQTGADLAWTLIADGSMLEPGAALALTRRKAHP